jgi:predicted SprT family Zn-dependent metalloprotease
MLTDERGIYDTHQQIYRRPRMIFAGRDKTCQACTDSVRVMEIHTVDGGMIYLCKDCARQAVAHSGWNYRE